MADGPAGGWSFGLGVVAVAAVASPGEAAAAPRAYLASDGSTRSVGTPFVCVVNHGRDNVSQYAAPLGRARGARI